MHHVGHEVRQGVARGVDVAECRGPFDAHKEHGEQRSQSEQDHQEAAEIQQRVFL